MATGQKKLSLAASKGPLEDILFINDNQLKTRNLLFFIQDNFSKKTKCNAVLSEDGVQGQ